MADDFCLYNKNMLKKLFVLGSLTFSITACGSDAPETETRALPQIAESRTFTASGKTYSPADFMEMQLSLRFDLASQTATGVAEIDWRATSDGYGYFLSEAPLLNAALDGQAVTIESRRDPDNLNTLRVIARAVRRGETHRLRLEYRVPSSRVDITSGVRFLTSMSDISSGNYFEAYAPAGFEYDAVKMRVTLEIVGNPTTEHALFANGAVTKQAAQKWAIEFPDYFTSSSFYIHLTDRPLFVQRTVVHGLNGAIPVTAYSQTDSLAREAIANLPALFRELEGSYGPYTHAGFVAYITAGGGGMEHAGATVTSLWALGHELTHSWFARGVIPTDGRSGWIDEAIASWRDNGYFRADGIGNRPPVNLARFSAFSRFTPANCYVDGRTLLSEIDFLLAAQGGLRRHLSGFFQTWQRKSVRTVDFKEYLELHAQIDLDGLFQTYVYGNDASFPGDTRLKSPPSDEVHPPALTAEEIRNLR